MCKASAQTEQPETGRLLTAGVLQTGVAQRIGGSRSSGRKPTVQAQFQPVALLPDKCPLGENQNGEIHHPPIGKCKVSLSFARLSDGPRAATPAFSERRPWHRMARYLASPVRWTEGSHASPAVGVLAAPSSRSAPAACPRSAGLQMVPLALMKLRRPSNWIFITYSWGCFAEVSRGSDFVCVDSSCQSAVHEKIMQAIGVGNWLSNRCTDGPKGEDRKCCRLRHPKQYNRFVTHEAKSESLSA